ncbi:hypothetical protein D3C73_1543850 [compost metagenome]
MLQLNNKNIFEPNSTVPYADLVRKFAVKSSQIQIVSQCVKPHGLNLLMLRINMFNQVTKTLVEDPAAAIGLGQNSRIKKGRITLHLVLSEAY